MNRDRTDGADVDHRDSRPECDLGHEVRAVARRVARLGLGGRFDPESAFIEREEVAEELRRLAKAADRLSLPQHRRSGGASGQAIQRARRLELLLMQRGREIRRLQALLAQAARPNRRRRPRQADEQLSLPILEVA